MQRKLNFEKPERIEFVLNVNVSSGGQFTATLPDKVCTLLERCGVTLEKNRMGNPGFMATDTLQGLLDKVDDMFTLAASEQLISSQDVLRYQFFTEGTGVMENGVYWPRGRNEGSRLVCGGAGKHCYYGNPYGIFLFVELCRKDTFRNKTGRERVAYTKIKSEDLPDKNSDAAFLADLLYMASACRETVRDVEATPAACNFFANTIRAFYAICEKVNAAQSPEQLNQFIAEKGNILISPDWKVS